jgi:hypothetical protein
MADPRYRKTGPPQVVRIESGNLIAPDEMAARIENFYPTDEGTLRSVVGPCLYQPEYSSEQVEDPRYTVVQNTSSMGTRVHGIFHSLLMNGTRDVLLAHVGNMIWQHEGWNRGWHIIVREFDPALVMAHTGVLRFQGLPDKTRPAFPTQFERTPNGIVIVPQTGRALFFDGQTIDSLGYSETPSAPVALGPSSPFAGDSRMNSDGTTDPPTKEALESANSEGYAHDSVVLGNEGSQKTGVTPDFRFGRVGTVHEEALYPGAQSEDVLARGVLKEGQWYGAIQWVDKWGNISPMSSRSNAINMKQQWTADLWVKLDTLGAYTPNELPDVLPKFIAWTGIEKGPDFTVGRILYRTKDVLNSGSADLFEVPSTVGAGIGSFATVPDNRAQVYPDNTPDAWLLAQPVEVVPVPIFKLCKMAFGRLWIANTIESPGMIRPSLVGRFGSFGVNEEIYPDPQGDEITGLWQHEVGLLVFTEDSTFLIVNNSEGTGFRTATVSTTVGCVAPSSIAATQNGLLIWLGRDGFYSYDGTTILPISDAISYYLRDMNKSRRLASVAVVDPRTKEYMCWLPLKGAQSNSVCYVFDGKGWRRRADTTASAACVTRDHREYVLVAGHAEGITSDGTDVGPPFNIASVWVLNRQNTAFLPKARTATIETVWLTNASSRFRKSPLTVFIWLRETGEFTPDISVTVYRDWKKDPLYTDTVNAFPIEDPPTVWGDTVLGVAPGDTPEQAFWARRRPYWVRASLFVPSCEVFKLEFSSDQPFDFFGFSIDTLPHDSGGARVPEGPA